MKRILYVIYKLEPIEFKKFRCDYFDHYYNEWISHESESAIHFDWIPKVSFYKYRELIEYCYRDSTILNNLSVNMNETSVEFKDVRYKDLYYILKFIDNLCYEVDIENIIKEVSRYIPKRGYRKWWYRDLTNFEFRRDPIPGSHKYRRHHSNKHNSYKQLKIVNTDVDYKEFRSARDVYHRYLRKYRHVERNWKSQYKVRRQYMIHLKN